MIDRSHVRLGAWLIAGLLVTSGCSGADDPGQDGTPTKESPTSVPTVLPEPPAAPEAGACYRLTAEGAAEATTDVPARDCQKPHTALTVAVDQVQALSGGHLLAIDSARVQDAVAKTCATRTGAFVGGSEEQRRLSILTPVWFTPTLAESDAGADWYRCDVVAAIGNGKLAPLSPDVEGALGTPEGRDRYGICATAAPGSKSSARVPCTAKHSWRAIATYDLPDGPWPNREKAEPAAETPCQDAALDLADSALDYEWGFDWPSKTEWTAGKRYGLCWAPA